MKVVIIGGSYAALSAFKSISEITSETVDITLISPSEYFWNNTTSPRLLIETHRKDETIVPLKKIADKHLGASKHTVNIIQAKAIKVDLDSQVIDLSTEKSISYDKLIIASGESSQSPAFRLVDDYSVSFKHIEDLAQKINKAKSIAIVGGGATGIEVAGELGYNYAQDKKIVVYTGSSAPLPVMKDYLRSTAQDKLRDLNIEVVNGLKATEVTETSITFSDDSSVDFDLVIPVFKSTPNTQFLDEGVLNKAGYVKTDEYFKVEGYPNVLAIGDVSSITPKSAADIIYFQSKVIKTSVKHLITGNDVASLKKYSFPSNPLIVVPISKNGGVGTAFGWTIPSFIVKQVKSKDFGISKSESLVS